MIAVVCPTIRPERYKVFYEAWNTINRHVTFIPVFDGENPYVCSPDYTIEAVMGDYADLIYNYNDGVRNLGFAYVAKYLPTVDVIVSLDDDVLPEGDTILQHINALNMLVSVSWMSTASKYTRGFPYNVRQEAEVVLSHGVWDGVKDWDAPSQLVNGNPDVTFYKGVVPKGIQFPLCAMNFAFKRKMLPYIYQAPMGPTVGLDRFADIWGGIEAKKDIDTFGWAAVTGYATVRHERASDVFQNLQKEAKGLSLNEHYGEDEYFKLFHKQRERWKEFINQHESKKSQETTK